jgi:hypothetical protein
MEPESDINEPIVESPLKLNGGPEVLRAYKGKVVAIVDGEVRASADTWAECISAVRKMGIAVEAARFWPVPRAAFVG